MKLKRDDYEHVTVLALEGDLTVDDVPAVRESAEQRLADDVNDFVLDLTQVEFVDSAGLEALLWLQDRCGERLGQVRLAGAGENVRKILDVTRLASQFERHADVDAAVRSLRI